MNQSDDKLSISPAVDWAESDGEILVVHLDRGRVFSLNNIGSLIWQGLEQGLSIGKIVAQVKENVDVSQEILESDTQQFLDTLVTDGLLVRA